MQQGRHGKYEQHNRGNRYIETEGKQQGIDKGLPPHPAKPAPGKAGGHVSQARSVAQILKGDGRQKQLRQKGDEADEQAHAQDRHESAGKLEGFRRRPFLMIFIICAVSLLRCDLLDKSGNILHEGK